MSDTYGNTPSVPTRGDVAEGVQRNTFDVLLRRALFVLLLVGLYLQINVGLPYGPFLGLGVILALVIYQGPAPYRPFVWFFPFSLFYLVLTGLTLAGDFDNQLRSNILFWLTMISCLTLVAMMDRLGPQRIGQWFWWLSVVLIVLVALERAGPLQGISDTFRGLVYDEYLVYSNDVRDLRDFGFIRPKVFTSEPSHLAKFLAVFLLVSAALSRNRLKHAIAGVLAYIMIGSPAVLVVMPMLLLMEVQARGLRRTLRSPWFMGAGLIGTIVVGQYAYGIVMWRFGLAGGGIEPSAYIRIVQPYFIMISALAERPLTGFGLGSEDLLGAQFLDAATRSEAPAYLRLEFYDVARTFGNIHFALMIQFGIVGGFVWLMMMDALRRFFGCSLLLFWSFYILYGYFIGPVHTPILWAPLLMSAWAMGFCRNNDLEHRTAATQDAA